MHQDFVHQFEKHGIRQFLKGFIFPDKFQKLFRRCFLRAVFHKLLANLFSIFCKFLLFFLIGSREGLIPFFRKLAKHCILIDSAEKSLKLCHTGFLFF